MKYYNLKKTNLYANYIIMEILTIKNAHINYYFSIQLL